MKCFSFYPHCTFLHFKFIVNRKESLPRIVTSVFNLKLVYLFNEVWSTAYWNDKFSHSLHPINSMSIAKNTVLIWKWVVAPVSVLYNACWIFACSYFLKNSIALKRTNYHLVLHWGFLIEHFMAPMKLSTNGFSSLHQNGENNIKSGGRRRVWGSTVEVHLCSVWISGLKSGTLMDLKNAQC